MKKLILVVSILVLTMIVSGCGGSSGEKVNNDQTVPVEITELLNNLKIATLAENAAGVADCACYPVTRIDSEGLQTFDTYDDYKAKQAFDLLFIDYVKYDISDIQFNLTGVNSGTVNFSVEIQYKFLGREYNA